MTRAWPSKGAAMQTLEMTIKPSMERESLNIMISLKLTFLTFFWNRPLRAIRYSRVTDYHKCACQLLLNCYNFRRQQHCVTSLRQDRCDGEATACAQTVYQ